MGIGFVILFHLIIIFILSFIIALIGSLITSYFSKERKRRKILFAFAAPFVGFYTLYFCAIIGSSIVSEKKNIDIGFGDCWYVPLENNCQLLFIDLPEQSSIEKDGETVISFLSEIQQKEDFILGKTDKNKYFSFDTKNNVLKEFSSKKELMHFNSIKELKLINTFIFYSNKYKETAGSWFVVVGFISLIISISVIYLLKMILAI